MRKNDLLFLVVSLLLMYLSGKPLIRLRSYTMWAWYNFFLMFAFPVFLLWITHSPLGEYGLKLGNIEKGLNYVIIVTLSFLPFLIYSALKFPEFHSYYPRYPGARESLKLLIYWEFLFFIYLLGWEYFFRGFFLFTLKKYVGWWSLLIQAIPFALLHIGKPLPEVYSSFFAGIILGYICLKAESFWPALLTHWLISFIFDLLIVMI